MKRKNRHNDSPAQIAQCQRCEKPKCNNCMEFTHRDEKSDYEKTRDCKNEIVRLFDKGLDILQISAETGRSVTAIYGVFVEKRSFSQKEEYSMKYIDAKQFAMLIADFQLGYTEVKDIETYETLDSVLAMLDEFPPADVVEVKHGRWLPINFTTAKCSSCNTPWSTHGADLTGNALVHKALYKYCPNCGAKMDGETE